MFYKVNFEDVVCVFYEMSTGYNSTLNSVFFKSERNLKAEVMTFFLQFF